MSWELACGAVPFEAPGLFLLARKHLEDEPGPFGPVPQVPEGFEAWVRRLMAKAPRERFQRTADAAWALRQLDEPDEEELRRPLALRRDHQEAQGRSRTELPGEATHLVEGGAGSQSMLFGETVLPASEGLSWEPTQAVTALGRAGWRTEQPPLPPLWGGEGVAGASPERLEPLRGVGLGLWGLRALPFVGRRAERAHLWGELERVHQRGLPRLVVVGGAAGVGKSQLVEWVAERAHEAGAAEVLRAQHAPEPGALEGYRGMLLGQLRAVQMEREQLFERVSEQLRHLELGMMAGERRLEAAALTELLSPVAQPGEDEEGGAQAQLRSEREQLAVALRHLERLARRRPLIVWLDDAHRSAEAVELARELLARPIEALVVLTARPEGGPGAEALEALGAPAEAVSRLELEPLEPQAQRALVRSMIGLGPALAARVERRAAGNPLFAIQLVGDLIERGVLQPGPEGFVAEYVEEQTLAHDLEALTSQRVERLVAGFGAQAGAAGQALELVAVLGGQPDEHEWLAACARLDIAPPEGLVDALLEAGLARAADEGAWQLGSQVVAEVLRARAVAHDRLRAHHEACAEALLAQPRARRRARTLARVTRHLIAAGELEWASRMLVDHEALSRSRAGVELSEVWLEAFEARSERPRERARLERARLELLLRGRANGLKTMGQIEQARALLEGLRAEIGARDDLYGAFLSFDAHLCLYEERYAEGIERARRAVALCELEGHMERLTSALRTLGELCHFAGRLEEALGHLTRAVELMEELPERWSLAWGRYSRASCLLEMEREEEAVGELREIFALMRELGERGGMSCCADLIGAYHYNRGDFGRACRYFRQAVRHAEAIEDAGVWISRENLARSLLRVGRWEEALGLLDELRAERERRGRDLVFLHLAEDARLTALAGLERWEGFDALWADLGAELAGSEPIEPVVREELARLVELLRAGGQGERAGALERALAEAGA